MIGRFSRYLAGLSIALSVAVLAVLPAGAQGAQPLNLPCANGISFMMLGQGVPQTTKGQVLVQLELTFAPGGELRAHTHPGILVVLVESGTLGFTMIDMQNGHMEIHPAGATGGTPETLRPNAEITFHQGDWFVEEGMVHSARNLGTTPVTVLISALIRANQPLVKCAAS